jgi:hypothetical protein
MADTPGSVVFQGREGTGLAQVFGRAGDPLQAYYSSKAKKEALEAQTAAAQQQAKQVRDKEMWNLMNVDPEKAYAPFNQQVIDAADELRGKIATYFEQGGEPNEQFKRQIKAGWDQVNHKARQSNHVKETIDNTMKSIEANPYQMSEYYLPKMLDFYMDEFGNTKPVEEIDYEAIQNITVNDPMGFNNAKYQKDFNSDLKTNVFNYQEQKNVNGGLETTMVDTKVPGDFFTYNAEKGDVERDQDGNPILKVTPTYQSSYLANENAKRYFEKRAQDEGTDVTTLMQQSLSGKVGFDRDVKRTLNRDPIGPWMYGQKEEKIKQAAFDREDKLNAVLNPVLADGSVNPLSQTAIGGLRGAKYLDGNIVDIQIAPGTNTPGQFKFGGRNVSNSPANRIIMTVKTSDRGQPQVHEIDLDSPEARDFVNGLYNASPAETQKFSTGQISQYTGRPWTSTTSADVSTKKKFAAEQENFLVDKVMNAKVDEDLTPDLEGKMYKGKPIIGAKKVITEKGWFTDDTAIEIRLPDEGGNERYELIKDKEEMRKVIKQAAAPPKSNYKDTSGKSWTREQLLKQYTEEELQWAIDNGILD